MAGTEVRQEACRWLLESKHEGAQDRRIGTLLEEAAFDEIHLAAGTPFETVWSSDPTAAQRVLSSEVAAVLRSSLIDVVEHGTAVRAKAAVALSDGSVLFIGGKTGTGDNRRVRFGARDRQTGSQSINRTATFVFFISDRFFGVVTAYVSGPEADDVTIASSLPTQILKTLGSALRPLFESDPIPPSSQEHTLRRGTRSTGACYASTEQNVRATNP